MKEGDVYRFVYHPHDDRKTDMYWCFDGQLIVKTREDGMLFLHDTYWGGSGGRTFTPEEAAAQGKLALVCNLAEVEEIKDYEAPYYAESDVFNLSHQHGCYKRFVKRKGARRDRDAVLRHLRDELDTAKREVTTAVGRVEWAAKQYQRAEMAADLDAIYI